MRRSRKPVWGQLHRGFESHSLRHHSRHRLGTDRRTSFSQPVHSGELPEWTIGHDWKSCVPARVPWVRIPHSPPQFTLTDRLFDWSDDAQSIPPMRLPPAERSTGVIPIRRDATVFSSDRTLSSQGEAVRQFENGETVWDVSSGASFFPYSQIVLVLFTRPGGVFEAVSGTRTRQNMEL